MRRIDKADLTIIVIVTSIAQIVSESHSSSSNIRPTRVRTGPLDHRLRVDHEDHRSIGSLRRESFLFPIRRKIDQLTRTVM